MDFEASGLSKESYPIEVGLTNGESSFSALIKPMGHWTHWDKNAERVHTLDQSKLTSDGIKATTVANILNAILEGTTVFCDSIEWDGFWLNVLFSDTAIHRRFEISDIKELLIEDEKLERYLERKAYIEQSPQHISHRALNDANVIHSSLLHAIHH
ncbi:hypothetical protein ACFOEK_00215 [Litoribrevibacter euphylliae]|uniref:Uncharacterized protein n=1 Tax=Litoribrevibacter euphylliae TaxID=1834034 RepID=A0ABV7H6R0_9GAMM